VQNVMTDEQPGKEKFAVRFDIVLHDVRPEDDVRRHTRFTKFGVSVGIISDEIPVDIRAVGRSDLHGNIPNLIQFFCLIGSSRSVPSRDQSLWIKGCRV
jgi:hypothetical protein